MPLEKPASCAGCPCPGRGFSRPEGRGTLGVLAIGEALGDHEYNEGLPFRPHAPAGSVLERALNRIKWAGAPIGRQRMRLWNVIACQPKGNWLDGACWEQGVIEHCRPNLDRVVHEMQPRCLLALGGVALRTLTGLARPRMGIQMLRGFVLDSTYGIPVVGTYHPSFLRRGSRGRNEETGAKTESGAGKGGMHLLPVLYLDILKAIEVAQHGWKKSPEPRYQTTPSLDDAWGFYHQVLDNPGLLVTADVETVESAAMDEEELEGAGAIITQIQFSTAPGTAIVLPWDGGYRDVARAILTTENVKAGHNFGHIKDAMLRLEAQGWNERAQLINQIHDALMFHIPDRLMDIAILAIQAEMEKPSDILVDPIVAPEGLWIETSVSVGRNWGAMEELDPRTGWAMQIAA